MKKISLISIFFMLISGCFDKSEFKAARFIRPDEANRYRTKGALIFGVIDKENAPFLTHLHFMLKKSEDITYVVNKDFVVFVFDVSENTEGLSRMVMQYYSFGANFWMNEDLSFKVSKDKLNYLGRFIFYAKDSFKPHRVLITNLIEEDITNLGFDYPNLTNMQIEFVGIKEGLYRFQ